jgi:nitrous oxidase accessory protein NosD
MHTSEKYSAGKVRFSLYKALIAGCVLSVLVIAASAQAATECVNPHNTPACYSTISDAVNAAGPGDTVKVAAGIYKEEVIVKSSVSLVGEGPHRTIIDATGLPNAIYINNGTTPVNNVVVSGFTLENANFEGILVNGASSVTIRGNRVMDNNKNLIPSPTAPVCTDLGPGRKFYPFETFEDDDCGEGIHFINVNSSVVAYNTVEDNAGGILLSDETGPTHDNSIFGNSVRDNVFDCGITLPSHAPFGVFHNTISGNDVSGNGISPLNGGGAGVGVFSPGGPTSAYGNSIVNNRLVGNGIAGVAMHTHAPGTETLQDMVISGNYIARNGPDLDLSPTALPDGIALGIAGGNVSGIVISGNTFDDEAADIAISANIPIQVTATLNNFSEHSIAVDILGPLPGLPVSGNAGVNATENWWGCDRGPGAKECSKIVNTVSTGPLASTVLSTPWLARPIDEDQDRDRDRDRDHEWR